MNAIQLLYMFLFLSDINLMNGIMFLVEMNCSLRTYHFLDAMLDNSIVELVKCF
jgi:hypothetical protein